MRKFLCFATLLSVALTSFAQSGTNSPYSQYGLGQLSEQSGGFNRGMNGLALGFHEHNQVNHLNPASYSEIDSLTFIFDVGMSGQVTNFKEGGKKLNANNADFEYAVAAFRAFRHLGVSFGILPYTNVGYNYSQTVELNDGNKTVATNTYSGTGGIHLVYLGAGWQPLRGLSIGAKPGPAQQLIDPIADMGKAQIGNGVNSGFRQVHFKKVFHRSFPRFTRNWAHSPVNRPVTTLIAIITGR